MSSVGRITGERYFNLSVSAAHALVYAMSSRAASATQSGATAGNHPPADIRGSVRIRRTASSSTGGIWLRQSTSSCASRLVNMALPLAPSDREILHDARIDIHRLADGGVGDFWILTLQQIAHLLIGQLGC